MRQQADCSPQSGQNPRIKVYVYGGGIAGMTAAHELVIRGFDVSLFEREQALGPRGLVEPVALGGLARSQYFALFTEQTIYPGVLDNWEKVSSRFQKLPVEFLGKELWQGIGWVSWLRLCEQIWLTMLQTDSGSLMKALQNAIGLEPGLVDDFIGKVKTELKAADGVDIEVLEKKSMPMGDLVCTVRKYLEERPTERATIEKAFARAAAWELVREVKGQGSAERLLNLLALASGDTLPTNLLWRLQEVVRVLSEASNSLMPLYESLSKVIAEESSKSAPLNESSQEKMVAALQTQGPESEDYFPQIWLTFLTTEQRETSNSQAPGFELTKQSEEDLEDFVRKSKLLIDQGYFENEVGVLSDVRVLVQVFEEPGRSMLERAVTRGGGQEQQRLKSMACAAVELLKRKLVPPLAQKVGIYTRANGEFLKASTMLGRPPETSNSVRVIVYRPQLPGEHGYRFFPSFYRHVFDTMKRIPRMDTRGQPAGGTVLDNLVPLPHIGFLSYRAAPFLLSWEPPRAGEALALGEYGLRNMRNLRISARDLIQYSLRVLRFMTTCSQRRAAELEGLAWWDYLEGYDACTGSRRYHYSESFKHLVQSSSRVLAALDGRYGDARSCGNTYVQLLTQALVPTVRNNCTLNGPTSEAWFSHWRQHLERLGVKFHQGTLQEFMLAGERLIARVALHAKEGEEQKIEEHGAEKDMAPVYFVVATDLVSAARAARNLSAGVPEKLQAQAFKVPERQGSPHLVSRDPEQEPGRRPWDRLQTISGIQYFFKNPVSVLDGYIYCVDAEWGLSAICSQLVWQQPPLEPLSQYQSILSVDIGEWMRPSSCLGKTAWECTPQQLCDEVLRQLRASLRSRGPHHPQADFVLPDPDWVHIDKGLVFGSKGQGLLGNKTPYLVPVVGDWKHRPGPEPWDPTPLSPRVSPSAHVPSVWQAPHGGYPVHHDRLVFAGTWLKTFTRLTTMESANESARHAVNAILDHYEMRQGRPAAWQQAPYAPEQPAPSSPYEQGLYPSTSLGDYCRIWNPERNELPDLELLQRLDERNYGKGLPHPWDLLGVELLPSLLSKLPGARDPFERLVEWVGSVGSKSAPGSAGGLVAMLRHIRQLLEMGLAHKAPSSYDAPR
jgi:uncharacterized protein with NAD-binding domain and iron-sulfur cluster